MSGGLDSYGPYRNECVPTTFASYVDRILKREARGTFRCKQPTKYELVINLKTAKALGLNVPDKLLALPTR